MHYNKFHKNTKIQKKIISKKNFTYRLLIETINKFLIRKSSILDIGCGAGTLSFYLASEGNYVTGIDISSYAIKKCSESAKFLRLSSHCQFKTVNFETDIIYKKFDLILLIEVMEHLEKDDAVLKKISKMLTVNGCLLISVPSRNAPLYKLGLTKKFDKKAGHLRRYNLIELKSLCKKNNLNVVFWLKTEGIIRNFLFVNDKAGKIIRLLKGPFSNIVTSIDKLTIPFFGESNITLVAKLSSK